MCGIYGYVGTSGSDHKVDVVAMGDLLRHRGPDACGLFEDQADGVVLGHRRLSIIDLSVAGHQPMLSEDGKTVLIFNGEIYNFRALRQQLEAKGHCFRSQTDSEVLVHGYEEWGRDLLTHLQGMFAFAIWDQTKHELFLARDQMGMKPLYYWQDKRGGFFFASEIKAFLGIRGFQPQACKAALAQYLEFNFIHDLERTSLEGVRKVPAGHWLLVQRALDGSSKLSGPTRYFQPPTPEPISGDPLEPQERVDRLFNVLAEVVQQHLVADVPVGLLLSGGLDSSLLAALAARHGPLRTLSMGFADSRVDERPFAKQVSEHVGSHHEEVLLRPQEVASELERDVWFVDDLLGDWGVLTTLLLYRKCRAAGVKVVLVGEGSDELFGGYPSFSRAASPEVDGHGASRRALRLYRWYSGRRWGPGYWQFRGLVRALLKETGQDAFAAVRLFETRHQLPQCYNMKVDKASMAASVEARVPFLDVRVATEGFRSPRDLLLQGDQTKMLVRNVALRKGLLPSNIVQRPKFGASMAASWMDEVPRFREFAKEVVLDTSGLTAEMGLLPAMRSYFEKSQQGYAFPRGISIFAMVAWRMLLLNLWARHYLRPGVAAQFAA